MRKPKIDFSSEEFRRRKRKIKYTSFIFVLLTLGVNIFAWFAYITSANMQIDATVAAWDVVFTDASDQMVNAIVVNVSKMKPGMEEFSKSYRVKNKGEVNAGFSYIVKQMELLGKTIDVSEDNVGLIEDEMKSKYPFEINFAATKGDLAVDESLSFLVNVKWDYEKEQATYYKLDEFYEFDPSYTYYQLVDGNYIETSVNSSTYPVLRDNLYLDKDTADSYFGEKCGEYEKETKKSCLKLKINMIVEQTKN